MVLFCLLLMTVDRVIELPRIDNRHTNRICWKRHGAKKVLALCASAEAAIIIDRQNYFVHYRNLLTHETKDHSKPRIAQRLRLRVYQSWSFLSRWASNSSIVMPMVFKLSSIFSMRMRRASVICRSKDLWWTWGCGKRRKKRSVLWDTHSRIISVRD